MNEAGRADLNFPFSAVVGQDDYKLALLACAVDPGIGGVLATGDRGTAKSTLARSFAELLPAVGDRRRAPFVELPLGATIDRLAGSVDTARLLAGDGAELRPGLAAEADGGVLYADEVNLLADHLVDLLLDASAFGRVNVERDGLSARHSSRFVLVGTMNPEEGELRPQLLDRFGLSVAIESPATAEERTAIVTRRIAFERDPAGFTERFEKTQRALAEIVDTARAALPAIDLTLSDLAIVSELCLRLGVEGVRGDIVTARAAAALAALDGRNGVDDRDLATAARLALAHRARPVDGAAERIGVERIEQALAELSATRDAAPSPASVRGESAPKRDRTMPRASRPADAAPADSVGGDADSREHRPQSARPASGARPGASRARGIDRFGAAVPSRATGRGARADGGDRPTVDAAPAPQTAAGADLDPIATARAAVTRRLVSGGPGRMTVEDLRERVRAGREANLVLCVVDASSSVLENGRAGELRSLLAGLVIDARRKRDRVGLIVFRGRQAELVAPPSRNHSAVLGAIESIEPGGTTPLAEGIRVAHRTALRELRRNSELRPVVALVTDGYANVGRGGDAMGDARDAARALRRDKVALVVIGETGSGAAAFARRTGAEYFAFDPADDRRSAA